MEAQIADLNARILILEESEGTLLKALQEANSYNKYLLDCNATLTQQLNEAEGVDNSDTESSEDEAETVEEVVMKDPTEEVTHQKDEEFPPLGTKNNKKRGKASDGSTSPILPKKAKNLELTKKGPTQKNIKKTGGAKKASPPPIIAFCKEHKKLQNNIKAVTGNQFTTLKIQGERTRIQTASIDDHEKVKELLKKDKTEMYTFTPKDQKPISLCVKNISTDYSEDEIKEALEEQIEEEILKVKHIARNNWLVQVKSAEARQRIRGLRYALGYKITVEGFRGQKVLQCRNCQRFNHLAINCNMHYRCVKCGQNHGPNNCSIPKKEDNNKEEVIECPDGGFKTIVGKPVKCANCSQQHTANYKGCVVRKKIMEAKAKMAPPKTQKRNNIPTNFVRPTVTYSQVAGPSKKQTTINITSKASVVEEVKAMFGADLETCRKKLIQLLQIITE
jgi:DNA-directed RNA polymerase subunit RPC12/RpoP